MSDATKPICAVCKQPIRAGEDFDSPVPYIGLGPAHQYASDCVAAAVRRCEEIASEVRGRTAYGNGGMVAGMIIDAIKEEFPEAFRP